MGIANIIFLVAFVASAAVQYNDPDPWRWIAIYGGGAITAFLFAIKRLKIALPILVGAVAFLWALSLLPHIIGKDIPMNEVFGSMTMKGTAVEETREIGGLLIVAFWMAVLVVRKMPAHSEQTAKTVKTTRK